jgi:KDO2-lipid IV(A) lauroyltransferase
MSISESNLSRYRFRPALLHPRHWGTWLGLALFFLFTLLPLPLIDAAGAWLGRLAAKKNRKRFAIARTNLSLCFPDRTASRIDTMVVEHFQAQLRSALHYCILFWRPESVVRKRIRCEGFEQIERYREQGRQIIALISHSAGLDFAVTALSMDRVANGPYKEVRNPVIDWLISRTRLRFSARHGGRLFTREDGLRPLIRETRAGKILLYLGDEDLGAENSVFVPFFGVPKATISVLGRLAKSCNAVVLPCIACYDIDRRQYVVKLLPVIEHFPEGDDLRDAAAMNRAIEDTIRQCPLQYLWTLRYFQTRPEGDAGVYE